MAKGQTVLIVDAETDFLEWAVKQLAALELRVLSATQADVAFNVFCREKPELVIVDTHLQPFSGMELLSRIRGRDSNAFGLLLSQFGTTQAVIEAMKLGAFDFVRKESLAFNFRVVVDTALNEQALARTARARRPQLSVEQSQVSIFGLKVPIHHICKIV